MNNYIINPSVFYWMNVFSILQTACAVVGIVLLLIGIGCIIGYIYNKNVMMERHGEPSYYEDYKRYAATCKLFMIICLSISIPMIIAAIFLPSKQTSVEMLVAKTATFDNVNWTVEQVKEIINYIVNALKGIV